MVQSVLVLPSRMFPHSPTPWNSLVSMRFPLHHTQISALQLKTVGPWGIREAWHTSRGLSSPIPLPWRSFPALDLAAATTGSKSATPPGPVPALWPGRFALGHHHSLCSGQSLAFCYPTWFLPTPQHRKLNLGLTLLLETSWLGW